jgi:hypothetical protein
VQFFRPALGIAGFFETYFELVRRGELKEGGDIPLLRVVAMVPEFRDEVRLTRPHGRSCERWRLFSARLLGCADIAAGSITAQMPGATARLRTRRKAPGGA